MKEKLIVGYSNLHRANLSEDGTYESPIRVKNAKKTTNKLKYESSQDWADDMIVLDSSTFAGGEGSLTTLGLTMDEYKLIFGHLRVEGGVVVTDSDTAKTGAWLWRRKKKGSNYYRLFCLYAATCIPTAFDAEAIEEGKAEPEEVEIEYTIGSYEHNGINYILSMIDTDDPTVKPEMISKWFTQVQFPTPKVSSVETKLRSVISTRDRKSKVEEKKE